MIEIKGNLFEQKADAICITTNGYVKRDGTSVMGRGCAKKATELYDNIEFTLGQLNRKGNNVYLLVEGAVNVCSFPVKDRIEKCKEDKSNVVKHMQSKMSPKQPVMGWACKARLDIIDKSCKQLVKLTNTHGWSKVVIPRPGCGAGELLWDEVKLILEQLDDRFYVITY